VHVTYREWWSIVHGFVFGGGFLFSFAGVAIVLYGLRRQDLTDEGVACHVLWLRLGSAAMAVAARGAPLQPAARATGRRRVMCWSPSACLVLSRPSFASSESRSEPLLAPDPWLNLDR